MDVRRPASHGRSYASGTGISHGFGLGTGTVAEGWLVEAVAFWEEQME